MASSLICLGRLVSWTSSASPALRVARSLQQRTSTVCGLGKSFTSISGQNHAFFVHRGLARDNLLINCKTILIGQQPKLVSNVSRHFVQSHGTVLSNRITGNRHCQMIFVRQLGSESEESESYRKRTTLYYGGAILVFMIGFSYMCVPAYKIFCQQTGRGGAEVKGHDASKVLGMEKVEDRLITVRFDANTHSKMKWKFQPQQQDITVAPGETALAFYTATNPTNKPIVGISTYNILPYQAGLYFNKIQCFCFEDQLLNPHEEVDMPVFFYIDPDYVKDPELTGCNFITLSYTFFESKAGMNLPLPGFPNRGEMVATPSTTPPPTPAPLPVTS